MRHILPLPVVVSIAAVALAGLLFALLVPALWLAAALVSTVVTLFGGLAVYATGRLQSGVDSGSRHEILVKGQDRFFTVLVIATSAFWMLCAPDVYFRDGGELAGAAVTLGVPHPTGFPVLCMLGKLAAMNPLGNVYFRINLLSGLAAAASAALAWLVVDRTARRSPGEPAGLWWVAPAVYCGSATAWLHAVTPEIYSISMLGLAALVAMVLRAAGQRDARWLVAASALGGIGAGTHVTMPVYGAAVILIGLILFSVSGAGGNARVRAFVRVGFLCVMAAMAGLLVVMYLPVAASRDPLMNWGDPSDLHRFVAHVTGQRIRDSFADQTGVVNFARTAANAEMAWRTFVESMAPVLGLAVIGCIAGIVRRTPSVLVMVGLVLADFAFAIVINPMGIRDLQVLLTATWATAVLAGIGAAEAVRFMGRRSGRAGAFLTGAIVSLLVLFQWFSSPADRNMANVFGPREISDRILAGAPHGSTVLTSSDDMSSVLLGRSAAEDVRPDMVLLVKQHLSDTPYVTRRMNPFGPDVNDSQRMAAIASVESRPFESGGESPSDAVARAAKLLTGAGDVFFEPGEGRADSVVRASLTPDFPLWRYGRVDPAGPGSPALLSWKAAYANRHGLDRWGRAWLAEYLRLLGTSEAMAGRDGQGVAMLRSALEIDPEDFRAYHNLGVLVADAGNHDAAVDLLVACVSINPGYVRGWQTLSSIAARAGMTDLASQAGERAKRLDPSM